jgi:hypothetical protein
MVIAGRCFCCRFKEIGQEYDIYIHCHLVKSIIFDKAVEYLRYEIRSRC